MRVVECAELGPVTGLRVVERPSRPVADGQVRIGVAASSVNYVDGLVVQGAYQIVPPVPFVPGMEVAGTITEVGAGVTDLAVGDRVVASVWFGGYASEAVADRADVVVLPPALDERVAVSMLQSYLTAMFALRVRGGVSAGEWLLVLGAGGGVGLASVDLGAALGLNVVAVASTDEKRSLALERGAAAALSPDDDVKGAVRELTAATGRGGADHLIDPVGGDLGETCLRALGENGQYLVIGFVAGIPRLPANHVLLRNRRITGVDWGAWSVRHRAENGALLDELFEMVASGRLSPVEPAVHPLDDAAGALTALAERRVAGRVVLVP